MDRVQELGSEVIFLARELTRAQRSHHDAMLSHAPRETVEAKELEVWRAVGRLTGIVVLLDLAQASVAKGGV